MKFLKLLIIVSLFWSCKNETPKIVESQVEKVVKPSVYADSAMVVSARQEASQIGVDILKKGGNAFDAMIGVEMALAVTFPYAGNLGGGGFMVYRTQYGEIGAFDYREKAPIAANKDMYLDESGKFIPEKSQLGALAVGVPGTIAGIYAVHEKLGSLPMEEILKPVIALARNGFAVTQQQAERFKEYRELFLDVNEEESIFTEDYKKGDTLKNNALANTLSRISSGGRNDFYGGETGKILVDFIKKKNGILSLNDLKAYDAQLREPIVFKYKKLRIISMSPPSSGGICLAQILKMVEPFPIDDYGMNSVKSIQVIVEAERRAFADRSFFLGDPDFVNIPVDTLFSSSYLNKRMEHFSFQHATSSDSIDHGEIRGYESMETTHYSIVDKFGNSVSVTTTLNGAFGSKLYVKDLGFFLNNEMDDFSAKPGEPNMFGLIGGKANAIEPQKRMLSSMTPTIVEKDGKFWMSVGTPGGSTIITSVLQTILNVYEYNLTMQQAVDAPRFHHQWLPDVVQFEPNSFPSEILEVLRSKGYTVDEVSAPVIGKVDAILMLPDGRLESGADRRGDDTAVGY